MLFQIPITRWDQLFQGDCGPCDELFSCPPDSRPSSQSSDSVANCTYRVRELVWEDTAGCQQRCQRNVQVSRGVHNFSAVRYCGTLHVFDFAL